MSWQDLVVIGPLVGAVVVAVLVLLVDLVRPGRTVPVVIVSVGGLAALAALVAATGAVPASAFGGAYSVDALTTYLDLLFVAIAALTIVS